MSRKHSSTFWLRSQKKPQKSIFPPQYLPPPANQRSTSSDTKHRKRQEVELEEVLEEVMAVELEEVLVVELEAVLAVVMAVAAGMEVVLVALDLQDLLPAMELLEAADLTKRQTIFSQSQQRVNAFGFFS
jgi:hypothetical protein